MRRRRFIPVVDRLASRIVPSDFGYMAEIGAMGVPEYPSVIDHVPYTVAIPVAPIVAD